MTHERDVFINCPFDPQYQSLFRAVLFAVHDCGFRARSALEVEDSGEVRVQKILRIIGESPYGIHDISRVDVPRFNMPLELGPVSWSESVRLLGAASKALHRVG